MKIKLKADARKKVSKSGMYLGNHLITFDGVEVELKKEEMFLLKSEQFKAYMEVVEVKKIRLKKKED